MVKRVNKDGTLSPQEQKALMQWLSTLQPVEPTEFVGNPDPSSKKPNKGVKRFIVGPSGEWGDLSDVGWWADNLANETKRQIVDPVVDASKMGWADPSSGLSPNERLATLINDGIVVGSLVAPAAKGTSKALSALDDLARMNQNRYMYGLHVSPAEGLTKIKPGSKMWDKYEKEIAKTAGGGGNFGDAMEGYSYFFNTSENPDFTETISNINEYIKRLQTNPKGASVYAVKAPKRKVSPDKNFGTSMVFSDLIGATPSSLKKKGNMKVVNSAILPAVKPRLMYGPNGEKIWAIDEDWKKKFKAIADFATSSGKMKKSSKELEKLYEGFAGSWDDVAHQFGEEGLTTYNPTKGGKSGNRKAVAAKKSKMPMNQRLKSLDDDMASLAKLLESLKQE